MIIAIGSDHAGFELKSFLVSQLKFNGFEVRDFGTNSSRSVDYPDYAHPVSQFVESNKESLGILICGSANGVCMTANKYAGIRCALCWKPEIAKLARQHNDANILALPARFVSNELAGEIMHEFLTTHFEGGRHSNRVNKI